MAEQGVLGAETCKGCRMTAEAAEIGIQLWTWRSMVASARLSAKYKWIDDLPRLTSAALRHLDVSSGDLVVMNEL